MANLRLLAVLLLFVVSSCLILIDGFRLRVTRGQVVSSLCASAADDKKRGSFDSKSVEEVPVEKGLTHIKYNKYAPPSEQAAKMTPEDFKAYIYKNMKQAERVRRSEQGGSWGSAISDSYIESLSQRKSTE